MCRRSDLGRLVMALVLSALGSGCSNQCDRTWYGGGSLEVRIENTDGSESVIVVPGLDRAELAALTSQQKSIDQLGGAVLSVPGDKNPHAWSLQAEQNAPTATGLVGWPCGLNGSLSLELEEGIRSSYRLTLYGADAPCPLTARGTAGTLWPYAEWDDETSGSFELPEAPAPCLGCTPGLDAPTVQVVWTFDPRLHFVQQESCSLGPALADG